MPKKLKDLSLLRIISSLQLTVFCLVLLVVIIIWGTVYQSNHGLYQAQQKFFHSWVFFIFGFIPFPGTILILFILFFNLIGSLFFRIRIHLKNTGIVLIHLGIIILLIGGFLASRTRIESVLKIKEGQQSFLSVDYHQWELAIQQEKGSEFITYAISSDHFRPGKMIHLQELGFKIHIDQYFKNCTAYQEKVPAKTNSFLNASQICELRHKKGENEPARNIPGVIFRVDAHSQPTRPILLYGADFKPTPVNIDGMNYSFLLRKRRYQLPFTIKLIAFNRTFYPASDIVRSYESTVELQTNDLKRNVIISMNKPLRYRDYSLYQSSFQINKDGSKYSILAVVKNSARIFPYISSATTLLGLILHFLFMILRTKKKKRLK